MSAASGINYNHRHRPTSDPSSIQDSPSSASINMTRSSSSEQAKGSKRKGTRSVSTLTPAQLARKRANDREAQRAIRARTKEHIERLETELEELRNQDRDSAFQQLLRKNRALQDEVDRLRSMLGVNSSSYPKAVVYDDNMSNASGNISSARTSPFPVGADYSAPAGQLAPEYGSTPAQAPYVPFPSNTDAWASPIPATVPSNVSTLSSPSPVSSVHDDFNNGYLPTSAPNPMMPSPNMGGMRGGDIKMEYEDGNDHGFRLDRSAANSRGGSAAGTPPLSSMTPQVYMQQQYMPQQTQQAHQSAPWGICAPMFYTHVPSPTVH